ncbi:MAG: glycosyltransferase [Candidatus Xenobium sp.]
MLLLQAALASLVLAACFYHLLAWALTRHFVRTEAFRDALRAESGGSRVWRVVRRRLWPSVSQIKPLHRLDGEVREALASFLSQDYPGSHEVLLVRRESSQELVSLCEDLARDHPQVPLRLVVGSGPGSNRKVASCVLGVEHAEKELLVFSDADMRAPPGYLRRVIQPFADPRVGLVTCLYAVGRVSGLAAALEGLSDADFSASVLVARRVEGLSFAMGATMAVRREALDEVGGMSALKNHLADDYQLGHRVAQAGWKVVLGGVVLEDLVGRPRFSDYFWHQLRWMRTYRICRPAGHAAFLVTQGLVWSLGFLLSTGLSPLGWGVLGGWLGLRMLTACSVWRSLSATPAAIWGLMAPLKDVLYLGLWVSSLVGNTVRWGGRTFQVFRDGQMRPLQ